MEWGHNSPHFGFVRGPRTTMPKTNGGERRTKQRNILLTSGMSAKHDTIHLPTSFAQSVLSAMGSMHQLAARTPRGLILLMYVRVQVELFTPLSMIGSAA